MNILVVEDDREMADVLVRGLQEEAHDVKLARDGSTALRLSGDGCFDLILLDVMLPGLNGLEVAKRLHNQGIGVTVVDPRWVLPVSDGLRELAVQHKLLVTLEDNGVNGGVGSAVSAALRRTPPPRITMA